MTNFLCFLLTFSIYQNFLIVGSGQTGLESYCDYIFFKRALFCHRFTSLDQLDFRNTTIEYQELIIQSNPDLNLEFNSSLNLDGLKLSRNARIEIGYFFRFDPYFSPFALIKVNDPNKRFSFSIYESNLTLTQNITCGFSMENVQNSYLFSDLSLNRINFNKVNFTSKLCPLMFKNTSVQEWYFITMDPVKYEIFFDLNDTQTELGINVEKLFVEYGNDKFVTTVNTETLLNELIFKTVQEIYFFSCYLESIDGESLSKFFNLNRISLVKLDVKKFLNTGLEWMNYLNLNNSQYFDIIFDGKLFPYHDSELCVFDDFPFQNKIIVLFDFELDSPDFYLPCSCVIYWLHKNYQDYLHLVKNNLKYSKLFPYHCFDISPFLLEEQLSICNNENSIQQCGQSWTQNYTLMPTESIVNYSCFLKPDHNTKLCTCSIGSINVLECSNQFIDTISSDLSSLYSWDYASFKGSSIKVINSFENLSLKPQAVIVVSNITSFGNDIFLNMSSKNTKFRFIIENSVLNLTNFSFRFTKFSSFEFKNCSFTTSLSVKIFEGSEIDSFIINQIDMRSKMPKFHSEQINEIKIRKIKIINLFNNFPMGLELDSNLLNPLLFKNTTEIEVVNTLLKYINSTDLSLLKLKNIRLDNINFDHMIDNYFSGLSNLVGSNSINLNDSRINWLWSKNIEKVYFGNNNLFRNKLTSNDTICFYAGLNNKVRVYFYENLNQLNGLECTCAIYWIYRSIDFSDLDKDPDTKYIPNCIKKLNSTSELNKKIDQCFDTNCSPLISCQSLSNTCLINGTSTIQVQSTSLASNTSIAMTTQTDFFLNHTTTQKKEPKKTEIYLVIGMPVIFAIAVVVFFGLFKYKKNKPQNKIKDSFHLEKF